MFTNIAFMFYEGRTLEKLSMKKQDNLCVGAVKGGIQVSAL